MLLKYLYPLLSVIVVSLVSFVGILFLSIKEEKLKKYIDAFIGLAVGALLGGSFIHILPETLNNPKIGDKAGLAIIIGIFIFFVMEKFLHWHHHGDDHQNKKIHPVGKLILFSDGVHNLIDGIIIGTSFLIDFHIGLAATIAVILHEIPQEIGDFAVLLHAGYSRKRALWLNFVSALMAVVGVIISLALGNITESFVDYCLPIAAGGFIYVAVADLIPELHKNKTLKNSLIQIFMGFIGVFTMYLLVFFE